MDQNAVAGQRKQSVEYWNELDCRKKKRRQFQLVVGSESDEEASPTVSSSNGSRNASSSSNSSYCQWDYSSAGSHEEETKTVLQSMVEAILSSDDEQQLKAITWFRRYMSIDTVQEVIDAGVFPFFVWFLESENPPKLQFQAVWALTNIAVEGTKKSRVILENDGVPNLLKLLGSTNDKVREQATWALRSVAVNSDEYYLLVLNHGFLTSLLELLKEYKYLSNLKAKKKQVKMEMLMAGVMTLPILSEFELGREKPSFEKSYPSGQ